MYIFFLRLFLFFSVCILFFLSSLSFAIVNIESKKDTSSNKEEEDISGSISLSANAAGGNTEFKKYIIETKVNWFNIKNEQLLIFNYEYNETNEVKDVNKSLFHARHIEKYQKNKAWEIFAQVQTDEFLYLNYRALSGAGLRYTFQPYNSSNSSDSNKSDSGLKLIVGIGLFYEYEEYDKNNLIVQLSKNKAIQQKMRNNTYFNLLWQINKKAYFSNIIYYQPNVEYLPDARLLNQSMLLVEITDVLSFKMKFDLALNNKPLHDLEKSDWFYTNGLEWKF